MIEPVALASITSAVTLLGSEFIKGVAGDASKATWSKIKQLLGWSVDPPVEEIPQKVATALTASPEVAEQLVKLLKEANAGSASGMVGSINAAGGKVVVAQTIVANTFSM
jgi:hypothetical protein